MKTLLKNRELSAFFAIVALFVVLVALNPAYFSLQTLAMIFASSQILCLLALGATLVMLTRNIDVSVGSTVGLCAIAVGVALNNGYGLATAIAFALAIGALAGAFNGLLVVGLRIPAIVATLGTLGLYRGVMLLWTGGKWIEGLPDSLKSLSEPAFIGVSPLGWLVLALLLALSFAGCSGSTAMTEKNVTATVDSAFDALKHFDTKKLEKYVDSKTLSVIITYANKHDQFADLGKALFKNLEYSIESIDLDAKTVTVSVRNKDLKDTASAFTKALVSKYSALQMLNLLNNETWLNTSLKSLTDSIAIAKMQSAPVSVTLTVTAGKKNLMLGFNDAAENAVSGGALQAVKSLTSGLTGSKSTTESTSN